jgi:DNA-binding transcriptional MerR regulator
MMKISEFAEFTQNSPRALRLYEELGLLTPHRRTVGGFRLYKADQAIRLAYIDRLQSLGCSLNEIQVLIESWRSQATAVEGMRALEVAYREKLNEVRSALEQLKIVEQELSESITFLQGCHSCTTDHNPSEACSHCDRTEGQESPLIKGISEPSSNS